MTYPRNKEDLELTDRQKVFVDHYIVTWNAQDAALRAGYSPSYVKDAYELLKDPRIQQIIADRMFGLQGQAEEVVARLWLIARANIAMFFNEEGKLLWDVVHRNGFLIQSIKMGKYGWEIKLHSAQQALNQLCKHYGLVSEHLHVSGGLVIGTFDLTKLNEKELAALEYLVGKATVDADTVTS